MGKAIKYEWRQSVISKTEGLMRGEKEEYGIGEKEKK